MERPGASVNNEVRSHNSPIGRILVAEDNRVNREVVVNMLKNLDYDVVIATTGQEAVEALQHDSFDLILMDCQMPVLDGYDATKAIRALEAEESLSAAVGRSGSKVHVPIVALTAHAFNSDRKRCLSVGMDDYLRKPLTLEQLATTLNHWLSPRSAGSSPAPTGAGIVTFPWPALESLAGIDPKALDNILAIHEENGITILAEVIDLYLDNSGNLMDQLRQGIVAEDYLAIGKAAHRLKSSSATLGAQNLTSLCQQLEVMSQGRIMDNPGSILADLETEYTRVRQTLSTILESGKTALGLNNEAELR